MPEHSVLVTRLALGTMLGVLVGLGGFVLLPVVMEPGSPLLRWGILLWYPTFGAVIAMGSALMRSGRLMVPWFVVGGLIGAWLNLVLTFFAHDRLQHVLEAVLGADSAFTSPFWFVLEGCLIGGLIGEVIGRFAGDDRALGPE